MVGDDIKVDDHVKWQDGDVERMGYVAVISDDPSTGSGGTGMAYVQDYATYVHPVEVAKLIRVPVPNEIVQAIEAYNRQLWTTATSGTK